MALSAAMQWALANGMSEADVYKNINDFLATNPDAATTQAQMAQYGISPQDVAAATGGTSGGMLSGNIMAGASWNSTNTALQNALTQATGEQTSNYAVGGSTTTDTLNQLNKFLAGGGQFDPNATVYLQAGGVDFIQGVDKGVVKDNLNQIVKTLGDQGVNVVLTGSPYAASVQDVVNNNFDPKVDQIFVDVAKTNSNVALVGTQGEILQNKALLVDALHTNAEGTAIYNQSVIDALSQFKNTVPASTPQAIAQAQQTNTVATTPSVITQAAASPAAAQTLARAIPTARGTVIEGDNIDAQIAGIPQAVYETRVDPNNPANWTIVNPKTNEVIDSGTFKGGGDRGLLAAAAPVIGLAAATVGLPGITGLLGGLTGATGSTLAGLTGAAIGGGTNALAGGNTQDILKAALLGGAGAFGGSVLSNLDVPVDFTNMTADQLDEALQSNLVKDLRQAGVTNPSEFLTGTGSNAANYIQESTAATDLAKSLSNSGLNNSQISQLMESVGFVPTAIADALDSIPLTSSTSGLLSSTVTTPSTGSVNVTGQAPTTGISGSLPSLVNTPVSTAGTVNVTGTAQPQQIDQSVLNLINSQIAANAGNASNLANVQVTGNKGMMSGGDNTANAIISTLAGLPTTTTAATSTTPTQTITSQKPATAQEIVNAITSTLPNVTPTQATTVAEQIITSGKPVTTQEVINAITASLPAVTTPTTTTPTVPTQTITAQKPTSIGDTLAAFPATLAPITTTTPTTTNKTNELGLTDAQMLNLLKGGLGLLGGLGGAAALTNMGGKTTFNPSGLPTQTPPMYTDDYFTKVQQNYNQLLPAVPRDVASPLRDWYTSQYGA